MTSSESRLYIKIPPPIGHAGLRALYDHWLELGAQASGLPSVLSFDPVNLPWILPNIWILEVDPTSHRFRMRLAGESINAIYGRNIGGRFFSDVFRKADLQSIVERYTRSLTEPDIFSAKGTVYAAAGRLCVGERLGLPMLGRSGNTDTLLGATYYGGHVDRDFSVSIIGDIAQFYEIRAANHRRAEIIGP